MGREASDAIYTVCIEKLVVVKGCDCCLRFQCRGTRGSVVFEKINIEYWLGRAAGGFVRDPCFSSDT
jgi:hypothetical protein